MQSTQPSDMGNPESNDTATDHTESAVPALADGCAPNNYRGHGNLDPEPDCMCHAETLICCTAASGACTNSERLTSHKRFDFWLVDGRGDSVCTHVPCTERLRWLVTSVCHLKMTCQPPWMIKWSAER